MHIVTLTVTTLIFSAAAVAEAQEQRLAVSDQKVSTVQQVLADGKDDQAVTLRGRVVRKIDNDDFVLADDTGEIHVDIDDDAGKTEVNVGASIEVHGEVDRDLTGPPEVEAERINPIS